MQQDKTYPADYSDEEIQIEIKKLSQGMAASNYDINSVMRLSPLIGLGLNELQKRLIHESFKISLESKKNIVALKEITNQATNSSKRSEKIALILTHTSIGIAVISALLTVFFFVLSELSNLRWEKQEIQVLSEQKQLQEEMLKHLISDN